MSDLVSRLGFREVVEISGAERDADMASVIATKVLRVPDAERNVP